MFFVVILLVVMVVSRRRKYTPRYPRRRTRFASRYRRGYSITRSLYNGTRRFVMQAKARVPVSFNVAAGTTTSQIIAASPWASVPSSAAGSSWIFGPASTNVYNRIVSLFDENKCDWVQIKLMPSTNIAAGTNISVYLWVDRKFKSDELRVPGMAVPSSPNTKEYRITGTSSRSAVMRVYAQDLHERITFHDCTDSANGDAEWVAGKDVGFMPGIFAAVTLDTAPAAATTISFNAEVTAQYTFRNLKF